MHCSGAGFGDLLEGWAVERLEEWGARGGGEGGGGSRDHQAEFQPLIYFHMVLCEKKKNENKNGGRCIGGVMDICIVFLQ